MAGDPRPYPYWPYYPMFAPQIAPAPLAELSRRDFFAAHALQGILASYAGQDFLFSAVRKQIVDEAHAFADAMIAAGQSE